MKKQTSKILCILSPLFLLLLLPCNDALGQAFVDNIPQSYMRRIKTIDQFMSRFNGTDVPEGSDHSDPMLRQRLLASLFDYSYATKNQEACVDFISTVIDNYSMLHYEDSSWCAIAECDAYYGKSIVTITLTFRTCRDAKGMMKWVIHSAEGDVLRLDPPRSSPLMKISPVDNELDFIHLKDITTSNEDMILNYSAPSFIIDQTSVFFTLVHAGLLRIGLVKSLSYRFDVGDHTLYVDRFNRNTTNSGWLISKIEKNK